MKQSRLGRSFVAIALWVAAAGSVTPAQEMGFFGWGVRGGLSVDPDQVFLGFHVDLGEPAQQIRLVPNVEIGFGDDQKLLAANCTGRYEFRSVHWDRWMPYAGVEVGFQYTKFDRHLPGDSSNTDVQLSALGGIVTDLKGGNKLFLEAKIGLLENPDLKAMIGLFF